MVFNHKYFFLKRNKGSKVFCNLLHKCFKIENNHDLNISPKEFFHSICCHEKFQVYKSFAFLPLLKKSLVFFLAKFSLYVAQEKKKN